MSFFKKKPPTDVVKTTVERRGDGTEVVTQQFELKGDPRPVRMDVVEALDAALGRLGANVLHAIDPSRILSFASGGPPVWSVGIVDVPGPHPYSLLLTYGFCHTVSPEDFRDGIAHEYSLAVPAGVPLSPWADALLRHQCRYVLTEGADIRVNDCIPLRGIPMTRIPFQPQHHANLPDSSLVGILATSDPVLGVVATPAGPIEVRRLVGIDAKELDRVETWSAAGFLEEMLRVDPRLLSPPQRRSLMDDPSFQAAVDRRAAAEGSDIDAAMFEIAWRQHADGLQIQLPSGQAAKRLLDALRGRVGFGRPLLAVSSSSPPIEFVPGEPSVHVGRALRLSGDLETGPIAALIAAVIAGASVLPLS
jgi:hypothetical protein